MTSKGKPDLNQWFMLAFILGNLNHNLHLNCWFKLPECTLPATHIKYQQGSCIYYLQKYDPIVFV